MEPTEGFDAEGCLLPHELFPKLHSDCYPEFVKRVVGGSMERIKEFWHSQVRHPCYEDHPMRKGHRLETCWRSVGADFRKRVIPIGIHGDGVASVVAGKSWSNKVEAFPCQSLLAFGMGCV